MRATLLDGGKVDACSKLDRGQGFVVLRPILLKVFHGVVGSLRLFDRANKVLHQQTFMTRRLPNYYNVQLLSESISLHGILGFETTLVGIEQCEFCFEWTTSKQVGEATLRRFQPF